MNGANDIGGPSGTAEHPLQSPYPVSFHVTYPDADRDRITAAFRLILVISIAVVIGAFDAGHTFVSEAGSSWSWSTSGLVVVPTFLMVVFRQKYPRWWFDFNLQLLRFLARVGSYLALLTDEYPSTDDEQAVHLTIVYPDAGKDLQRFLPLVKWLLALPHVVVLAFAYVGAVIAVVIAWFSIVLSGTYPRSLFDYVVGVQRYGLRVLAYALILTTDVYPPFSLKET